MEYAYAVLMLNEADAELNETNITGVLDAAGVDVEESRVKAMVAALEDVDVSDVLPADDADVDADVTDDEGDDAERDASAEDADAASAADEQGPDERETVEESGEQPAPDPDADPDSGAAQSDALGGG